ncbi:MAG: baseplate J/gp47 family protein [Anaerolineae bacterium]|nr:baseplate J/gp47 family protein [Anaerolineae bacterium]
MSNHMEQIIYLEIDDDITTTRDRLRRAQSKQVLMVVPPRCQALRRQLDFRLLSRQAAALQMDLALISGDAALRDMAVAEGLTVFTRLSLGQRMAHTGRQWSTYHLPGLDGLLVRLASQKPRWWNWVLGPLIIVLVMAAIVWSGVMIVPSATIGVVPAREPVGVSLIVEADPMQRYVDWERLRLPARFVQVDVVERGEVETTGYANVAADKAVGTVLFVNKTQRQIVVPTGTQVTTSAGTPVLFVTTGSVAVGPRSQARVSIQAVEGGPSGNVAPLLINRVVGALTASVSVVNEGWTSGGTSTQSRRVTHGDKQRATDLLWEKLVLKAYNEIVPGLDGEFLPLETLQINPWSVQTNYDHHVDDKSDTLALEMRGSVWGMAMSEEVALEIARRALERQVRGGFHLLPESTHFTVGNVLEVNDETLTVRFVVEGVGLMEADIDQILMRKAIAGRPVDEALAYLRQTLPVELEPTLQVEPEWMIRVPWMSFRIHVVYEPHQQEVARALSGP